MRYPALEGKEASTTEGRAAAATYGAFAPRSKLSCAGRTALAGSLHEVNPVLHDVLVGCHPSLPFPAALHGRDCQCLFPPRPRPSTKPRVVQPPPPVVQQQQEPTPAADQADQGHVKTEKGSPKEAPAGGEPVTESSSSSSSSSASSASSMLSSSSAAASAAAEQSLPAGESANPSGDANPNPREETLAGAREEQPQPQPQPQQTGQAGQPNLTPNGRVRGRPKGSTKELRGGCGVKPKITLDMLPEGFRQPGSVRAMVAQWMFGRGCTCRIVSEATGTCKSVASKIIAQLVEAANAAGDSGMALSPKDVYAAVQRKKRGGNHSRRADLVDADGVSQVGMDPNLSMSGLLESDGHVAMNLHGGQGDGTDGLVDVHGMHVLQHHQLHQQHMQQLHQLQQLHHHHQQMQQQQQLQMHAPHPDQLHLTQNQEQMHQHIIDMHNNAMAQQGHHLGADSGMHGMHMGMHGHQGQLHQGQSLGEPVFPGDQLQQHHQQHQLHPLHHQQQQQQHQQQQQYHPDIHGHMLMQDHQQQQLYQQQQHPYHSNQQHVHRQYDDQSHTGQQQQHQHQQQQQQQQHHHQQHHHHNGGSSGAGGSVGVVIEDPSDPYRVQPVHHQELYQQHHQLQHQQQHQQQLQQHNQMQQQHHGHHHSSHQVNDSTGNDNPDGQSALNGGSAVDASGAYDIQQHQHQQHHHQQQPYQSHADIEKSGSAGGSYHADGGDLDANDRGNPLPSFADASAPVAPVGTDENNQADDAGHQQ